jgi:DNA polymerase-1
MPPTIYLLDGHALAYRTYFALTGAGTNVSRWKTSQGEPTAGIYGFASVLLRLLEQEQPDYLAVAFDVGKTFRDEIYPEYKATREKMPDDLRTQIERIRELVDTFNIPRLEMEGYEADDVLGSAAKISAAKGLGVKIITGDRDLLQLVDERIIVSLPGRKLSDANDYTINNVHEVFGVRPDQVIDYKALMGDSSDNIPGVRGVGKKTAASLLGKYDNLDNVYAHLDEMTPGLRKNLENDKEQAYLSQKLAKIITDLDIHLDFDQARTDHFNPAAVEALFRDLEFRTLVPRLNSLSQSLGISSPSTGTQLSMFTTGTDANTRTTHSLEMETVTVQSKQQLAELVQVLEKAEQISFDTETTSTDQMQADLVGIALAVESGKGYYIPVGHNPNLGTQLRWDDVISAIRKPLTDPKIPKVGHNIKYDYVILARHGLEVFPLSFDTMIAEWLRDPASRNLGLKNLAWIRLNAQMTEISELIGTGKKQITMAEVEIDKASLYACADAVIVLRLIPLLRKDLEECQSTYLFENMEMPLISVLADMEMSGIGLNIDFLEKMSQELEIKVGEIEKRVFKTVGEEFNLNSTQQLSVALFDLMGLEPPPGTRKTVSGHYSTAASVLDSLREQHDIVEWILEHRELTKLKSTYVDALPEQVNANTGRVHTSYNQTGTVTGRIASTNPNLQNIPIRTDIGRRVRNAFIAQSGFRLLSIDYSQIELRIAAHMANDESMLSAFRADQDIHAATAAAIYSIPINQVTRVQRRHAKAINFGLLYGMSPYGLTRTTELTLAEAEDFVDAYFTKFPGIKKLLDDLRYLATKQEYVETLLRRRRYFYGLSTQTNQNIRNRELREAINAPIQGTAADIMKRAMLNVQHALKKSNLKAKILLQVHDELVLECPETELVKTARLVKEEMESAFHLKVPLKTDTRTGENWGKMVSLEI